MGYYFQFSQSFIDIVYIYEISETKPANNYHRVTFINILLVKTGR